MKYLICFFLIGLSNNCKAQSDTVAILVTKLERKIITDTEKKTLRILVLDIQNRGQILDESSHDYKGALQLTDSAINLFKLLNDTLGEANNIRFKGYLLGRFGKYEEGKKEIQKAIHLFQSKKAYWGVAVSQYDLSRLYEFQNLLDSALHYCNTAIFYWKQKGNVDRVFIDQNMLINLLTKANDLNKAKTIQQESSKISESTEQHWQSLLDFYVVSEHLYKASAEFKIADTYHSFYSKLIAKLNSAGIEASSYFNEK